MFFVLNKVRNIIKDNRGTTLVELLLTASFLPVAMAVAYFVLNQSLVSWKFSDHKAEALNSARYLVDRIGRDLRQAERPFIAVDTDDHNYITFKADINKAEGSELISYSLEPLDGNDAVAQNGEQVVRSEYDPYFAADDTNHINPIYPNIPTRREVMAKIVRNNKVTPKVPLFTFKKANGAAFVPGDDIHLIREIDIDIFIKSVHALDNEAIRVSNAVRLRNF